MAAPGDGPLRTCCEYLLRRAMSSSLHDDRSEVQFFPSGKVGARQKSRLRSDSMCASGRYVRPCAETDCGKAGPIWPGSGVRWAHAPGGNVLILGCKRFDWFSGFVLGCLLLGCSSKMDILVIRHDRSLSLEPRAAGCELELYSEHAEVPETCVEVGDVYVGDPGRSRKCGQERVEREIRDAACAFGANAAQVVTHHEPTFFGSSCHQMRARFLRCDVAQALW